MTKDMSLERLFQQGEIRIGFQRHTPPFSYGTKDMAWPVGYSVSLAKQVVLSIAAQYGRDLRITPIEVTSSTRTGLLASGAIDMECGSTSITEERKNQVAFSRPIFHTAHRVALKFGRSLSNDKTTRITGISNSTCHHTLLDWAQSGANIEFCGQSNIEEAFHFFTENPDVDGFVADELILAGLLGSSESNLFSILEASLGAENYGFMMRKEEYALHHAVNQTLNQILNQSNFSVHYAHWFNNAPLGVKFNLGSDFSQQHEYLISLTH